MMRAPAALAALLLVSSCAETGDAVRPYAITRRADVWQNVALDADRRRLAALLDAWASARAEIGAEALAALGPLADPDVVADALPPGPGAYRCRLVRMGRRTGEPATVPVLVVGDPQPCTLVADGPVLRLAMQGGPQQLNGTLYADDGRQVFLGTMALAGEMGRLAYGMDAARDQVGVLRAIGPARWRLELPWPRWQSRLLLVDITPAA
jgi:hypothetical protein